MNLTSGGYLILGQRQDNMETSGFFDEDKAFSGSVTQFEMWDQALQSSVISGLNFCKSESTDDSHR